MDAAGSAAMNASNTLASLFLHFALLSLFAVGGANAAIPEIHRIAVEVQHWMTDRQFADMFAIAQVSPGPNLIIVTLIGYHAAGLAGALVATVAMCGPTCVVAFWVGRIWDRFKEARWRIAIQAGLVPVSIGLMAASAYIVAGVADHNAIAAVITAVAAAVTYWTRINPLWIFAVAGIAGFAGFV
jgi:chromate transporter